MHVERVVALNWLQFGLLSLLGHLLSPVIIPSENN